MRGKSKNPEFRWTEERIKLIKERYQVDGPGKLAEELGTTRFSVMFKARRLGLGLTRKKPREPLIWTDVMVAAMKDRYASEGAHGFAKEYGVPVSAIYHQAALLGISTTAGKRAAAKRRAHFDRDWETN